MNLLKLFLEYAVSIIVQFIITALFIVSSIGLIEVLLKYKIIISIEIVPFVFVGIYIIANAILWKKKDIEQSRLKEKINFVENFDKIQNQWKDLSELQCGNMIANDLNDAINAMKYLSKIWLNDSFCKDTIKTEFFEDFNTLYQVIDGCNELVLGYGKRTAQSFITDNIRKAYREMLVY